MLLLGALALALVLSGAASWTLLLSALGILLNGIVSIVNGGKMPVMGARPNLELRPTRVHQIAQPQHRLLLFADWLHLGNARASIGDVLLALGLVMPLILYVTG